MGLLFDRLGERGRAEEAWRRGIELVQPTLETYPDNNQFRLFLACFHGLLGEHASFLAEEERILEKGDFDFELYGLAAVHAKLGETERAVELLRNIMRQGSINPAWKSYFEIASVFPLESEAFRSFVEEYEAEERRLRETY